MFVFVGTDVTVVVADDEVVIVDVPLTNDHAPIPDVGLFPAKVNVDVLHKDWSAPAAAVVTDASFLITTSSVELQVPLVTVQRNVMFVFVGTDVTVVVADDEVVIVDVPLTNDHAPIPDVGLFPAKVNVDVLHKDWSAPAAAVVTDASFLITTSSVELQVPLVTVQRNVMFVFVGTDVTVVVAEDDVVIVDVPLTNDHAPIPDVGLFPAKVNVEVLHKD
jgi:predicted aconitase with swiveling domain